MIVSILLYLRKHNRKYDISNIQCLKNSAYQEINYGRDVNNTSQCLENTDYQHQTEYGAENKQCLEDTGYLEVQHQTEYGAENKQYLEDTGYLEVQHQTEYGAENKQRLEKQPCKTDEDWDSDYEECVF